jgi:hypothetical protein
VEPLQTERPANVTSPHTFACYFFKGSLWYVRLLQLFVGGWWGSPSHVVYSIDDTSYEITTKGLLIGETDVKALYRACDDAWSFELTPAQAFAFKSYFSALQEEGHVFNVWTCIRYVWSLIFCSFGRVMFFSELLSYGQTEKVQPYEVIYCPPFTCTTPMWEALEEQPPAWNAFSVSHLYAHLMSLFFELPEEGEEASE